MNKLRLEPCTGCFQKYGYDINSFNQCCIDTCSSFIGGGLNEVMNSDCGKSCVKGMLEIIENTGKNPCQFFPSISADLSTPPPFLPSLIEEKGNIPKALLSCRNKCYKDGRNNPRECQEACDLAAAAVLFGAKETYDKPIKETRYNVTVPDSNEKKNNYTYMYVGISVLLILLLFLAILYLQK